MNKLLSLLVIMIISAGLPINLFAQEKCDSSSLVALSRDTKVKLKSGGKYAIFLSGNDALFTRIMEDALSIHLTNAGFAVASRERLEKTVGDEMNKKRKEKAEGAINALEIGKAVGADCIIIGTVIIEIGEQSTFVKIASFQLVAVENEKTLISHLLESEKGKLISDTAKEFVNLLKQHIE